MSEEASSSPTEIGSFRWRERAAMWYRQCKAETLANCRQFLDAKFPDDPVAAWQQADAEFDDFVRNRSESESQFAAEREREADPPPRREPPKSENIGTKKADRPEVKAWQPAEKGGSSRARAEWQERLKRGLVKNELKTWACAYPVSADAGYPALKLAERDRYTLMSYGGPGTASNTPRFPRDTADAGAGGRSCALEVRREAVTSRQAGHVVYLTKYGEAKVEMDGRQLSTCVPNVVRGGELISLDRRRLFRLFLAPDFRANLPRGHFLCLHAIANRPITATLAHGFSFARFQPCMIGRIDATRPWWSDPDGRRRLDQLRRFTSTDSLHVGHPDRIEPVGGEIFTALPPTISRTLDDRIEWARSLPPSAHRFIFRQIVAAVAFLHHREIAHGGIRPAVVRLLTANADPIVQLTDIGLAPLLSRDRDVLCPPEVKNFPFHGSSKGDVWSVGTLALQVAGRGEDCVDLRMFLGGALERDAKRRRDASWLIGHPWVSSMATKRLYGKLIECYQQGLRQQQNKVSLEEV